MNGAENVAVTRLSCVMVSNLTGVGAAQRALPTCENGVEFGDCRQRHDVAVGVTRLFGCDQDRTTALGRGGQRERGLCERGGLVQAVRCVGETKRAQATCLVNPGGNPHTVPARGRVAGFLSWYSRRIALVNPGGNPHTVPARGRVVGFLSWYSRRIVLGQEPARSIAAPAVSQRARQR